MPLYEYYCSPCGSQFEMLRPVSHMDNPAVCPSGHTTNNRVLSVVAPFARPGNVATATPNMPMDDCCSTDFGGGCSCC